ncbi:MAG: PD-(D/E)XK nuclease family protein [Hyphomicrobiales bacterium]
MSEIDEIATIRLIEDFLVGSGASDFRELEKITNVFCPFEAIGMVNQEIKHSSFLSYILDENKPHNFGNKILEVFLGIIADQSTNIDIGFSKLDIHFMDISNATIFRERWNIDLLIEIPREQSDHEKGLVIAVELKIRAAESDTQLSRYKQIVEAEFPSNQWEKKFVFLTLNEDDPSEDNSENWIPVGLPQLINRLEGVANSGSYVGESVNLLSSYIKMMKRNFMTNNELETLARKIWTKHRSALDALQKFYPDLLGEIMEQLLDHKDEIAEFLSVKTGYNVVYNTSYHKEICFYITDWDIYSQMATGDGSWLENNKLMAITLMSWGKNKIRISYIIGPGEHANREAIYSEILKQIDNKKIKIGRKTPIEATQYKHLSADFLLTDKRYIKAETSDETAAELIEGIKMNAAKFLNSTLPIYDVILQDAFGQVPNGHKD